MLKAYHKSTGEHQTKRVFSKAMVPNIKLPLPDVTLPELIDNVEEILVSKMNQPYCSISKVFF